MRWLLVLAIAALVTALAAPSAAAARKVLVMPVDGTADAATRARLTAQLIKLAKAAGGQVSTAEATFHDTTLAVGCQPQAPGCTDEVIATLGVDELVWGTATTADGRTRLVVWRAVKGSAPREVATTIAAGDAPDKIDPGVAPLFRPGGGRAEPLQPRPARGPASSPVVTAAPDARGPAAGAALPRSIPVRPADHRDRNLGIAFATGGGVALGAGIVLWASYASTQDQIDGHRTLTRADFDELRALEDRAAVYAIAGDLLVVAGLAAGSIGAYYLYRSHRTHRVAITPAPMANGAGLALTLIGGL